jgi:hypothetical protein
VNPDHLKHAWQTQSSQTRLSIDAELFLKEVRRNQQYFTATIFWRDIREIGISLLMALLWIGLGVKHSSPWTWYLPVPALLWIAGYMLADRMRHGRQPHEPNEPLLERLKTSLAQIQHQIWLLRNVCWWYLLPIALATLVFFGQSAWQERSGGLWTAIAVAGVVLVEVIVLSGVYLLNRYAICSALEPRRQELEALLMSLKDEPSGGSA